jgi:hypothetical protein
MRKRILIALLALGTIGGFGSGIASLVHHARHHACDHTSWHERSSWHDHSSVDSR